MKWTKEKIDLLTNLYKTKTDAEIMEIMSLTNGQLRGAKSRFGLNQKIKHFTDEEKKIIEDYYINTDYTLFDLNELSKKIGRQKTSISRYAKKVGLTDIRRKHSDKQVQSQKEYMKNFYKTEDGIKFIEKAKSALKEYLAVNGHPRGMLGKHHTEETRNSLSISHIEYFENLSDEEKHNRAMKSVEGRIRNGTIGTTNNAYSNCKGGFREDLNQYFRSSWEANIVRIFNYSNIKWKYECKRFLFNENNDGICSYQPDFYLPEYDLWIEVKGWMDDKSIKRIELFKCEYPFEYKKLVVIDENFYYWLIDIFKYKVNNLEKADRNFKYKNMQWADALLNKGNY